MEIEVKILAINRAQILSKLAEIGAKQHFKAEFLAIFYDDEKQSIRQKKAALRLRKEGNKTFLTFKLPISTEQAKIMDEREVEVADVEKMRAILQGLGYTEIKKTRKIREEFEWKNVKIVLDEYLDDLAFIPLFLEIEAPNLEEMYEAVYALGYTKSDCNTFNTYELANFYADKKNMT